MRGVGEDIAADISRCRFRPRPVMSAPPPIPDPNPRPEKDLILPQLAKVDLPFEHKLALSVLVKRARYDFETYLLLFNRPGGPFIYSKLHRYLVERVQGVVDGRLKKRQITSVPPQHGKSSVLAMEAASWLLGKQPGIQVAITGFSNDLVTDFSKWIRARTQSPIYQLIFPGTVPVFGSNRMDSWRLTNGSGLRAKPIGSKLTGRRVDWLIIDDPHAGREEAESITMRKRVFDWYFADCYTRLSPSASVFIIGTRWHPEDLIGSLTHDDHVKGLIAAGVMEEVFDVTNLPAVCEDEENDPLGRKMGEPLFPEFRTAAFLRAVKANLPVYEWMSQYMGKPMPSGAGQVEVASIIWIDMSEVPEETERVRSWDLAITEDQKNDFIAGALMTYDPSSDYLYIMDMWRGKKVWPKFRPILFEVISKDKHAHNCHRIGIEAVAGFGAVFQDVKASQMGECRVQAIYPPKGGKQTRAMPWFNKVEAKKVFAVRGDWKKAFETELQNFPEGEHDDQIDAVSGGWEMLRGPNRAGVPLRTNPRPSGATRPPGSGGPVVVQHPRGVETQIDEGERLRRLVQSQRQDVDDMGEEASDFSDEEREIAEHLQLVTR